MQEQLDKILNALEKLTPQVKWGATAGIVVLLCGLFYYFVVTDYQKKIAKETKEYSKLQQTRAERENYVKNLALYEAKYNELQNKLGRAKSLLPDSEEVPGLLSNLSALGEKVGLSIERFVPQNEKPEEFYAAIPFKMKVYGNYHDIAMYIDAIGRLDRIVNVSDINMSTPKVINKKIVVNSEFIITTYRFLNQAEAAAEDAKNAKDKKSKRKK